MLAAVMKKAGAPLAIESIPRPPSKSGLVVEVLACGVCHTDLDLANRAETPVPLVLGHEIVATDQSREPYLVYASWGCRSCKHCAKGDEAMCRDVRIAGVHRNGGYAAAVAIPDASYLLPIGGLDPSAAAPLADAGATSYRAVRRALPAARAIVIGVGGLGQFAVQWLQLLGDSKVTAVDIDLDKRQRALALGAVEACVPTATLDPVPVVVDFVGSAESLRLAKQSVERGGKIILVGGNGGSLRVGMETIPYEAWVTTSIMGSRDDVTAVIDHARRSDIAWEVESLPLSAANDALDRLRAGDVAGRLALRPD